MHLNLYLEMVALVPLMITNSERRSFDNRAFVHNGPFFVNEPPHYQALKEISCLYN